MFGTSKNNITKIILIPDVTTSNRNYVADSKDFFGSLQLTKGNKPSISYLPQMKGTRKFP